MFDESIQPGENYDGIRIFVVEDELSVAVEFTKEISGKHLLLLLTKNCRTLSDSTSNTGRRCL